RAAGGAPHAALIDRKGRGVARAVGAGFADERLDGLAATITTDFNILVLGHEPAAMARAVNRLLDLHGGIVLASGEGIAFELALPLGGIMTRGTLGDAARWEQAFREAVVARGYPHHQPGFTPFFLAADFLPDVRLTPRGVWDVKRARVLLPARRRRERCTHCGRRDAPSGPDHAGFGDRPWRCRRHGRRGQEGSQRGGIPEGPSRS